MKSEIILLLTLEENGYEDFVSQGSGLSRSIQQAMERYVKEFRHKASELVLNSKYGLTEQQSNQLHRDLMNLKIR